MSAAARMVKYRAKKRLARELARAHGRGVDVEAVIAAWRHGDRRDAPGADRPVTAIAVTPSEAER